MVRVLLQLARILNEDRKKNQLHSRLLNRVLSLLTGKRSLLNRACNGITREDLAHYIGIVDRAGDDFPPEVEAFLEESMEKLGHRPRTVEEIGVAKRDWKAADAAKDGFKAISKRCVDMKKLLLNK